MAAKHHIVHTTIRGIGSGLSTPATLNCILTLKGYCPTCDGPAWFCARHDKWHHSTGPVG